jgi:phosphoenolpyruvate synthase/pyruvate phosphate dikinase
VKWPLRRPRRAQRRTGAATGPRRAGIKQRFGGKDQDIEWAVQGDQLIILQSRPFISAPQR